MNGANIPGMESRSYTREGDFSKSTSTADYTLDSFRYLKGGTGPKKILISTAPSTFDMAWHYAFSTEGTDGQT